MPRWSAAISRSEQPCKGGSASRATRINPSIPTEFSETQKTLSVRDLLETGRGELFQSTTSSSRCETSFFCRRFTGASDARTVHSTPSTNGLVGHDNTALKQHFLNVAQGQIEAKLQSDMPLSQSNGIKHETGGLWWIVARSSLRQARMGQAVLTAVSRWHHWQQRRAMLPLRVCQRRRDLVPCSCDPHQQRVMLALQALGRQERP